MDALALARQARDLALTQALNSDEIDAILDQFLAERERCVQMSVDALLPEMGATRVVRRRD